MLAQEGNFNEQYTAPKKNDPCSVLGCILTFLSSLNYFKDKIIISVRGLAGGGELCSDSTTLYKIEWSDNCKIC